MAHNELTSLAELFQLPFPVIYLDFRSIDRFLYRIHDLGRLCDQLPQEVIDRLDNCYLYMICKRPRLTVVPNAITWDDESISLKVSVDVKGVTHVGDATIIRTPEIRDAKSFTASTFPHRKLLSLDHGGKVIHEMLMANFAHLIDSLPPFAKQLEVLYIGKGLSKNTQDRLASHQTLQKVLAEINSDDPESEVFALVYSFDYRRSTVGVVTGEPSEAMRKLLREAKPYQPTLDDKISLIEAAAISYFRTDKFNSHYIDFPTTDTDAARRARESGADYLVVLIDTENIGGVPIYSQHVDPQMTHQIIRHIGK